MTATKTSVPELPVRDVYTLFGLWASRPVDISLEALSGIMNKHGVMRAATLSTTGIFADSRRGNDITWQAAAENLRLLPMGTVDPRGGVTAVEEMAERAEQGFRIFGLFPATQVWSLEHIGFVEILKVAAQANALVMIEAGRQGWPTQIARTAESCGARVILSGITYRTLGEALMVMKTAPLVHMESHLLTSSDGIEQVVERCGPERLLFGSGAPLKYFSSAYLRARFAQVSAGDRSAILGGNFARLLEPSA
jgi:predicted TIM-barrel fold metal-dependent hydrolase